MIMPVRDGEKCRQVGDDSEPAERFTKGATLTERHRSLRTAENPRRCLAASGPADPATG